MKTSITIITGYLGSGKTTLLRKIISDSTKKLAILMNEFGEIGIDGQIIKGKNVDIAELSGGCVCCSLTGEFELAVKEILEKVKPDAIVIETTGVAEPSALTFDIEENIPSIRLDVIVTLVDADSLVRFPTIGHTGREQIEMADIILLNKVDLIDKKDLERLKNKLNELNPRVILFETVKCEIDINLLFGLEVKARELPKPHVVHDLNSEYFVYSGDRLLDLEKFNKILEAFPKKLYRAKGFIRTKDGSKLFNYVAGRYNYEPFEADKTELIFIGQDILKLKDKILKRIEECEIHGL
ncbi:GTP-binding protein [Candidatus Micrarchaeota archaeon]|nr:GTP-binding protein [Candidatus Micrarchaeota archaeon]